MTTIKSTKLSSSKIVPLSRNKRKKPGAPAYCQNFITRTQLCSKLKVNYGMNNHSVNTDGARSWTY